MADSEAKAADGTRPLVMLVEDDKDIRESVADVLRATFPDARVESAASGEEALVMLGVTGARLVLTDYMMPGMDGIEFMEQARRIVPTASFAVVSAYPEVGPLLGRGGHRLAFFLPKPLDVDALLAAVALVLRARAAENGDGAAAAPA